MWYSLKSRNDKLMAIIANANGSREMRQSKWNHRFVRTLAFSGWKPHARRLALLPRRSSSPGGKTLTPLNAATCHGDSEQQRSIRVSVLSTVLNGASRTIRLPSCRMTSVAKEHPVALRFATEQLCDPQR